MESGERESNLTWSMSSERETGQLKQEDRDGRPDEEAAMTEFRGQSGDGYLTTLQR